MPQPGATDPTQGIASLNCEGRLHSIELPESLTEGVGPECLAVSIIAGKVQVLTPLVSDAKSM
jgi:hypothetical protein